MQRYNIHVDCSDCDYKIDIFVSLTSQCYMHTCIEEIFLFFTIWSMLTMFKKQYKWNIVLVYTAQLDSFTYLICYEYRHVKIWKVCPCVFHSPMPLGLANVGA